MYRQTFLEINVNDLYHNLEVFNSKTNKKMMAIVKANAYGLIDYKLAKLLEEKGVDFFGVSSLDEAIRLREHGINSKILIMGYVDDFEVIRKLDIAIITPDFDFVKSNKESLKNIKVHIKVNTGLNRLGVLPSEAKETLDTLLEAKAIPEGIMTHYACYDDVDYTYRQYNLFRDILDELNYKFEYIHTAATDAALYLEDEVSNYVRIGLGLFGYANIEHDWDLKPVLSLKAGIVSCKKVEKGSGVSYGHHYISDGEGYINTVTIGYSDGISRKLENKKVYIGDEECKIVGTICMDLMMVLSKKPHKVGEFVELIGEHISVEDRKVDAETCCCNVITDIQSRVTRIYIKDGKVVSEIDERQ